MLKKLFLPLFALTIIGVAFIQTKPASAITMKECEKYPEGTARSACQATATDREPTEEEKKKQQWEKNHCSTFSQSQIENCGKIQSGTVGGRDISAECSACKALRDKGYKGPNGTWLPNYDPPTPINPIDSGDDDNDDDATPGATVIQRTGNDYREGYDLPSNPGSNLTVTSGCRGFLGMVSWDCNTNFEDADSQDDVPRIVVMIAANIFTDITVIASYLVIAYIIYGGYLYIFANGETSKVTTGKKALNQAFIGLAITLSANIIINAIRIALMHNSGSFTSCASSECISADSLVSNLIQWVIGIGGAVAAVFIVGGGIMYMTSAGDPTKLQTAKNIIKYALIGLIIVALSEVVTIFMTNVIVDAKKDAKVTNDTSYIINTKELYENQKIS